MNYDDLVIKHWPEFGKNGKDLLKIKDILRHEAGLYKLHKQLNPEDCFTENILNNSIGSVIESDISIYPPNYLRMYHPITRDWITNEIFRRVDPKKRTMGQYLREEFCPEYDLDIVCGANDEELAKIRDIRPMGYLENIKLLWKGPRNAPVTQRLGEMKKVLGKLKAIGKDIDNIFPEPKNTKYHEVKFDCKNSLDFVFRYSVDNDARRGEYPSYNMHSNATSLARIAAFMAN